jgi:hypothetical protein
MTDVSEEDIQWARGWMVQIGEACIQAHGFAGPDLHDAPMVVAWIGSQVDRLVQELDNDLDHQLLALILSFVRTLNGYIGITMQRPGFNARETLRLIVHENTTDS